MGEEIQCRVIFSGRVQGVGFRWTTQGVVSDLPLSGYVRNLPDGRVELLLQGSRESVDNGLSRVEKARAGFIENTEKTWEPITKKLLGFSIV